MTGAAEQRARRDTLAVSIAMITVFLLALTVWIVPGATDFSAMIGLSNHDIPAIGWIACVAATSAYIAYVLWAVPPVRTVAIEVSWFRIVGIPLALLSGIVEELFFRQYLMDTLQQWGAPTYAQILLSALAFASAHIVWLWIGGDWETVLRVVYSVTMLGVLMSLVYLASERSILPALVAHSAINLIIEPGLLLHSIRRKHNADAVNASATGR